MSQLELTERQITHWRDLPFMVAASSGNEVAKVRFPLRFQEAIDEAAMRLKESDSDAYLAGWIRSDWEVVAETPTAASQSAVRRCDDVWPQTRIGSYLYSFSEKR